MRNFRCDECGHETGWMEQEFRIYPHGWAHPETALKDACSNLCAQKLEARCLIRQAEEQTAYAKARANKAGL